MDKEMRDRLYWLDEELREEKPAEDSFDLDSILAGIDLNDYPEEPLEEEIPALRKKKKPTRAERMEQQVIEESYPMEDRSVAPQKKKGIKGLVILAVLEIIGILAVLAWWLQWLV